MNNLSVISTRDTGGSSLVSELIYELLDAHHDTAQLASLLPAGDLRWQAHLQYLADLQRVGREALAHMRTETIR